MSQQEFPAPDPLGPRGGRQHHRAGLLPGACGGVPGRGGGDPAAVPGRRPRLLPHADQLTLDQVRDSLPDLLRHIADALESRQSRVSPGLKEVAPVHAATRFQQRFDVDELVAEYRILRQIILEEVHRALGRDLRLPELIALDVATGFSIQEGVATFVEHEKQEVQGSLAAESRYLSFLAHDLRNNLNACTLTLELLAAADARVAGVQGGLRRTWSRCSGRSPTRSRGWTGCSRPSGCGAARRSFTRRRCASRRSPARSRTSSRAHAEQKGLSLDVAVPPDAVVHSDAELIALVLQNLVGNAIKYSTTGRSA